MTAVNASRTDKGDALVRERARAYEGAAATLVAGLGSWGKGGFGRRKGGRLLGAGVVVSGLVGAGIYQRSQEAPPLRSTAAPHERVVAVAGMRQRMEQWLPARIRESGVCAPSGGSRRGGEVSSRGNGSDGLVWSRAPVRCPGPSARRDWSVSLFW
jgi:hypothetical protein